MAQALGLRVIDAAELHGRRRRRQRPDRRGQGGRRRTRGWLPERSTLQKILHHGQRQFGYEVRRRFRYGIFDNATLPSVTINGAAKLGGALVPYLLDGANVSASDRFTLMTAANMVGHFSNVAMAGACHGISFSDGSVLGTFLLTINKRSIVLSDFQPAQGIPESHATRPDSSKTLERGLDGNDSDL